MSLGISFVLHVIFVCLLFIFVSFTTLSYTHAQVTDNANTPAPNDPITTDANGNPLSPSAQQLVNSTDSQIAASSTLSNDGIFGCRGVGAQVANVGTQTAIGGIYVPVNDAAVTLNTGFLVYKECILDGVARKIAENVSAEYLNQSYRAFSRGRGGNPQYLVNWDDLNPRKLGIVGAELQRVAGSAMCDAFKRPVQGILARNYLRVINEPGRVYSCPFGSSGEDQQAFYANQRFTYGSWFNVIRPSGNFLGAAAETQALIDRNLTEDDRNIRQMLDWGRGVFSTTDNAEDPLAERVITPGFLIADSIAQLSGSGFRQLENANEIDQVVGNLFGGLTTQLISDTRGLEGLSQSVNGQPSYLDRMTAQTSANVRQQATNAALSIIGAARQIEVSYRTAKEAIATALSNSIEQLRSAERQCWALIIPAVQTYASSQGVTTLTIATTTQFSQQVIDSQIAPLATTTINEIRASDATIATLNELIASVSNSASQANQQQALLRLDTLVANGQLRTSQDATNAAQQRDNVLGELETLVRDTVTSWGDSTDPNIGWCNVNNTAVVERWFNAWRQ